MLFHRLEIKLRGEMCHPWSVMELGPDPALWPSPVISPLGLRSEPPSVTRVCWVHPECWGHWSCSTLRASPLGRVFASCSPKRLAAPDTGQHRAKP